MKLTVNVPSVNEAGNHLSTLDSIERAFARLRDQLDANWETIVGESKSTDEIATFAEPTRLTMFPEPV